MTMHAVRAKLIKSVVDRAPVPSAGSKTRIWDTQIPSFLLRVLSSGRRVYCVKCRVGCRQRWVTLGEHGKPQTVEAARSRAMAVLGAARGGVDPTAEQRARAAALFVDEMVALYLKDGPASKPSKRTRSWESDASRLLRHVLPCIGKMSTPDLTRADIERMRAKIAIGATAADERTGPRGRAIVTGGPIVASACVVTLSAAFNWARQRGLVAANPCEGVKKVLPERRERFLSTAEAKTLLNVLGSLAAKRAIPLTHASILRLLLFTGARKGEILGLQWGEVDLERRLIRLPRHRSKTGEKSIVLNRLAVDELARMPRASVYVFPNLKGGAGHTVGLYKSWRAVREAAQLTDVRIHDLRHSFASFGVADGSSLYVVQRALGHAAASTTERYAHLADDPVRDMAERIADRLAPASDPSAKQGASEGRDASNAPPARRQP